MQQVMDVAGNAIGGVSVADTISEDHSGNIVSARKYRRQVTAFVSAGGNGNYVAFQAGQFQRAVGALVAGPELHATEGALLRRCTFELGGFNFLESHGFSHSAQSNHTALDAARRALRYKRYSQAEVSVVWYRG